MVPLTQTKAASNGRRPASPPRSAEILITADGLRALEERLAGLRSARASEFSQRMREVREFGDTSGNDEYLSALEDDVVLDSQIGHLEELVSRAKVVDDRAAKAGTIVIGSVVSVEDQGSGKLDRYRIVGSLQAGGQGLVTAGSAVGEALLGRRSGETVELTLPSGEVRELRVVGVELPPEPELK